MEQAIKLTESNEINIILGDLNAKVGRSRVKGIVGGWSLGERRTGTGNSFNSAMRTIWLSQIPGMTPRRFDTF